MGGIGRAILDTRDDGGWWLSLAVMAARGEGWKESLNKLKRVSCGVGTRGVGGAKDSFKACESSKSDSTCSCSGAVQFSWTPSSSSLGPNNRSASMWKTSILFFRVPFLEGYRSCAVFLLWAVCANGIFSSLRWLDPWLLSLSYILYERGHRPAACGFLTLLHYKNKRTSKKNPNYLIIPVTNNRNRNKKKLKCLFLTPEIVHVYDFFVNKLYPFSKRTLLE